MSHACRICGNAEDNETFATREMMFDLGEEFEYFMCAACGCLQIASIPDDMSRYYPDDYLSFPAVDASQSSALKLQMKRLRTMHALGFRSIAGRALCVVYGTPALPAWLKDTGMSPDSRVLDVGCGSGYLIAQLQAEGFLHLTGVDPFVESDRVFGNGIRLFRRELADMDESFDLIMLHHSFEHVPDPISTLRTLRDKLLPGGVVLIRTPVVPSYVWDEYGTDWVQLDAPRHLHLHSVKSMDSAARTVGMQIESIAFDSEALQFWGSEQYRRGIPLMDSRSFAKGLEGSIFTEAEIAEYDRLSRELNAENRGDQACFVLSALPDSPSDASAQTLGGLRA